MAQWLLNGDGEDGGIISDLPGRGHGQGLGTRTERDSLGGELFYVRSERPRSRRYPFIASIEVTDIGEETQFIGLTDDVSVYGCAVNTKNLLPKERTVRVRITHAGTNFVAMGKVTHANPGTGIGIVFTKVEPNHQAILENWIDQLREVHA